MSARVYFALLGPGEEPGFEAIASAEEKARSAYLSGPAKDRFQRGRILVRNLLGRLYGVEAGTLQFRRDALGKPHLVESSWEFSLSHADPWSLCAAVEGTPIGTDLVRIDPQLDPLTIARDHFGAEEFAALRDMEQHERTVQFAALWAAKEARAKYDGTGITAGLDRHCFPLPLTISPRPELPATLALWFESDSMVCAVVCPEATSIERMILS